MCSTCMQCSRRATRTTAAARTQRHRERTAACGSSRRLPHSPRIHSARQHANRHEVRGRHVARDAFLSRCAGAATRNRHALVLHSVPAPAASTGGARASSSAWRRRRDLASSPSSAAHARRRARTGVTARRRHAGTRCRRRITPRAGAALAAGWNVGHPGRERRRELQALARSRRQGRRRRRAPPSAQSTRSSASRRRAEISQDRPDDDDAERGRVRRRHAQDVDEEGAARRPAARRCCAHAARAGPRGRAAYGERQRLRRRSWRAQPRARVLRRRGARHRRTSPTSALSMARARRLTESRRHGLTIIARGASSARATAARAPLELPVMTEEARARWSAFAAGRRMRAVRERQPRLAPAASSRRSAAGRGVGEQMSARSRARAPHGGVPAARAAPARALWRHENRRWHACAAPQVPSAAASFSAASGGVPVEAESMEEAWIQVQ